MKLKSALIIGIDSQDGAFLTRHLVSRGDRVGGTWLDGEAMRRHFNALGLRGLDNKRFTLPAPPEAWHALLEHFAPGEIYFLAGVSSVGMSFAKPSETLSASVESLCALLECLRETSPQTRLFYAGSVECFGATPSDGPAANEETPFRPGTSPYAVGKAAAMELMRVYRTAYGMHLCSGILSNHESPLRSPSFVTRKVVDGVLSIKSGRLDRLELGNLDVRRDWGWAEEYVETFPLMLRAGKAEDFVIATGRTRSLREFVALAFERIGLGDWRPWVVENPSHFRLMDIPEIRVNPGKVERELGWRARTGFEGVVEKMLAGANPDGGLEDIP